jgi:hypothetical protein
MAAFNKFQTFAGDMLGKVHDLVGSSGSTADALKLAIARYANQVANTNAVLADITKITGTGYADGSVANACTPSGGTAQVTCTASNSDVVFTASGADWLAGDDVVLYNDTPTSPADPLIGWWEYGGTGFTLANGESFTVDFGAYVFQVS